MNDRVSIIGTINVNMVEEATVLQIGDSTEITPFNYTIAVQRERAIFIQSEFDFSDYSLFSRPLVQPVVNEPIRIVRINESPRIDVHHVHTFRVSSSAVVHIGSSERLKSETRIKHVRHLLREEPEKS